MRSVLKCIGKEAFRECEDLLELEIPENVELLDDIELDAWGA